MQPPSDRLSFGPLDWLIIVAYMLMLVGIGWYYSRRQQTLREYFLAGKHMSWLPIGLSLMAALNSGIDYLMQPSAFLKFGIVIILSNLSWLVLYPYAFFITMPMYRRLDVYSAYEYLENRFNVQVRCLAASIFILWRLGWMATALYVPCLAFHTATGGQLPLKPTILVLGAVATLYTMLGGVKAVIWTEVIQFLVMFGGLLLTLIIIFLRVPLDFATLWEATFATGVPPTAPSGHGAWAQVVAAFREPITWYGVLIATLVGRLTGYTSDQVMVQRFQTSRTIRDVRQGFIITAVSDAVWMMTLTFIGVTLYLYFQGRTLPEWVAGNTDYYFPYFMAKVFPPGTTGPVIAAIIAASLSAIASAINSQSTVIVVDFYNRLVKGRRRPTTDLLPPDEQRFQMRLSRAAAVAAGLAGTILACYLDRLGTLFEIANKVIQTFTGPVLAIFWLGMFTRRATSLSAFLGGLVGTGVGVYVAFFSSLSFLWPAVFAFASAMGVGYIVGVVSPTTASAREWNWFTITTRPLQE